MLNTIQYCEMRIATPPDVQMRGLHCWVMVARVVYLTHTSMCHFNITYTELGNTGILKFKFYWLGGSKIFPKCILFNG